MRKIIPVLLCTFYASTTSSGRSKREERLPWQTVIELQRIFQAGNRRALDIETFTKQAAIRQNEQNALLASSGAVLSPMAAMAAAANRFSPPEIVLDLTSTRPQGLPKAASSRVVSNDDFLVADRRALVDNEVAPRIPNFPLRDIPPPAPPPPLPPPVVILPRLLQPRYHTEGIGVVETPLVAEDPPPRFFISRDQDQDFEEDERSHQQRPKLPTREESNAVVDQ